MPAMASYQPTTILNVTPPSRASLAPTGEPFSQLARDGVGSADINFECNAVIAGKSGRRIARSYRPTCALLFVGAELARDGVVSAMASYHQPTTILNVTPSSRASLAPTGEPFSQLARDGVVGSADINFECNAVIAGKSGRRIARSYRPTCALLFVGAELARDGVVSADNNFECNAVIAGKPCSYR
ncbi:hypothetical protein [Pseudomonas putida]|uniref:hypothetical protein n=1 Tax=Pseudomonas putida TaxID=303 RepID=UPI003D958194